MLLFEWVCCVCTEPIGDSAPRLSSTIWVKLRLWITSIFNLQVLAWTLSLFQHAAWVLVNVKAPDASAQCGYIELQLPPPVQSSYKRNCNRWIPKWRVLCCRPRGFCFTPETYSSSTSVQQAAIPYHFSINSGPWTHISSLTTPACSPARSLPQRIIFILNTF
jgi:hypothetical protein